MNASVSSRFGHLTLAVLLSLPLALLLWSIASFAVAITYFAFLKRSGVQQWLGVGATTATAAGMCLSVGITLYFFWGIWERTDDRFSIVTLLNSAFSLVSWSARKREVESEASPDIEKGSPEPSVAEKPSAVKRFTM